MSKNNLKTVFSNTKYKNRLTSTLDSKYTYKFTVLPTVEGLTKKQCINLLVKTSMHSKTVALNSIVDIKAVCKSTIICPAVFKKEAPKWVDDNVKSIDFISLDIDSGMTMEEAQSILDKNELSYILYTSKSHTSKKHKFHIIVALLKPIKDKDIKQKYKATWQYLHELLECKTDPACKNPSRALLPSAIDGIVIDKLYRNDLYLGTELLNKYKYVVKTYDEATGTGKVHPDFIKQIENINPNLIKDDETDFILRYKRDINDPVGNLFCYYPQNVKCIFDLTKSATTDLLFSNYDYEYSFKPEAIRTDIQQKIKNAIEKHHDDFDIIGFDFVKTVIVANEGVGKTRAILENCKKFHVIYACDTTKRIIEMKESFQEEGIDTLVCYSNKEIMEQLNISPSIIESYSKKMQEGNDTKEFINEVINDSQQAQNLLDAIQENNKKILRRDVTVLLTTEKLKVLLKRYIKEESLSLIVLDEFEVKDFYPVVELKEKSKKVTLSEINFYNDLIRLEKNNSLIDLLCNRSAIILTTEKEKVKRVFYNKSDYPIRDFTKKLKTDNIKYLLTSSTSNVKIEKETNRDNVIKKVLGLYPEIDEVICDASDKKDSTHLSVRGSDNYKQLNTLVVGHYPSPVEHYLFFKASEEYYKDKFGDDKEAIAMDINCIIMSTKVSQSIGRNSGFRDCGKFCYVILPMLRSSNCYTFKSSSGVKLDFDLNYVSSNVERLDIEG
ncbi:hypothetical protein [Arcobacter arenosus]|uniref:Uncharacterized protein n=1 Tax=Arcobacter arenosus TaxID=2576037 RepID=A0A5R8XXY3_9BACT|nr:hypothetical protein [Arcobacter arenosus]TLP36159.1 hypothetical protein FDK22_12865 [Arcobacter arenosus]